MLCTIAEDPKAPVQIPRRTDSPVIGKQPLSMESSVKTTASLFRGRNFRVLLAIRIIESEYRSVGLDLKAISERIGVSRSHLCRVFRHEIGIGIPEWIRRVRVEQAEKLLRETAMSVKEVASVVGFTYVTQLDRVFRKHFGKVPTQYRIDLCTGFDSSEK
jgi:AraC-like DNA-binding protein